MGSLVQTSIDGVLAGAAYGLSGLGFGFVYLVIRRIDLSYGACLMAGLYAVVAVSGGDPVSTAPCLLLSLAFALVPPAYSQWVFFSRSPAQSFPSAGAGSRCR